MAIEKSFVQYKEFGKCAKITNGEIELLVTLDMGPRVISFGFVGGKNEFKEALDKGADTSNGRWSMIGGHRLWHSPEDMPLTYTIDDKAVDFEWLDNGIRVISKIDEYSRLQKEFIINMDQSGTGVQITNNLHNKNPWAVEYSAWALTVMAPGGKSIMPQNTQDTGFLSNRSLTIWPYTNMADPRLTIGDKLIIFRQDPNATCACKIGFSCDAGWATYINEEVMFVKRYNQVTGATYPDNGCSYETYTCDFMMELETLSPLVSVKPNDCISHSEQWQLFKDVKFTDTLEGASELVDKYIK